MLRRHLTILCLAFTAAAPEAVAAEEVFRLRVAKLEGDLRDTGTREHASFCAAAGFNGLWVDAAPGPRLDPGLLDLARWSAERGLRLFVAVAAAETEAGRPFVYDDPEPAARLKEFMRLLQRDAGVRDIVLSFDGAPTDLSDLRDITRFGRSAATAQLDLARRLQRGIGKGGRLWLLPSVSWERPSGAPEARYAVAFAERLESLRPGVGIVWSGSARIGTRIDASSVATARRGLGNRPMLVYDRFPANGDVPDSATALVLGALRGRDPALATVAAGYVSCPMNQLGASRLPLLTVADFLAAPGRYDPEGSLSRAIDRLAGGDAAAREALRIQAMEWGGPVGDLNYQPATRSSPQAVAARVEDPAFVASFEWTVARYPERLKALLGLADAAFRDDLLRVMGRRLAIARLIPLVSEYRERVRAGRADAAEMLPRIAEERSRLGSDPDARRVTGLFLQAAEVPDTP